jgi:hypothetical protein
MRAKLVIIPKVASQDTPQMLFPQHDDLIETFATDTPNEALHVRILPRTPRDNHDLVDAHATAQLIQSPYGLEARCYGTKRDINWVGYKVHLSETCDEDHPHLITQGTTTLATTSDFVMGEPIEQDLADRALLPGSHLVDRSYVVAALLVNGPRKHHIDVVLRHEVARLIVWQPLTRPVVPSTVSYVVRQQGNALSKAHEHRTRSQPTDT